LVDTIPVSLGSALELVDSSLIAFRSYLDTSRPNELKPIPTEAKLFHMSTEELLIKTSGITAAAIVVSILIYYTLKRKG